MNDVSGHVTPKILSIGISLPKYSYSIEQILPWVSHWLADEPEEFRQKALKIFKGARIRKRHSICPIELIFSDRDLKSKNDLYQREIIKLASEAFESALVRAKLDADEISAVITTSCTGFMIPALDVYLIERFKLSPSVHRLPVTEMGCAGGAAGLLYARDYLRSNAVAGGAPKYVAVIAAEAATNTFLPHDRSLENIVSTAIFADGAACCILSDQGSGVELLGGQMAHIEGSTHWMGFNLQNDGFKIILDRCIPDGIEKKLEGLVSPFLDLMGIRMDELKHLVLHPGGQKIIQVLESYFEHKEIKADASVSRKILEEFGNLSSATVFFILNEILKSNPKGPKGPGLMMAFGPGFTGQLVLLRF